ncbi:hypothetical protein J6590_000168 [Homalodisca vitripennis]|nr:hypothetical protein J6590_000168 [Homalodisca vitripennis]
MDVFVNVSKEFLQVFFLVRGFHLAMETRFQWPFNDAKHGIPQFGLCWFNKTFYDSDLVSVRGREGGTDRLRERAREREREKENVVVSEFYYFAGVGACAPYPDPRTVLLTQFRADRERELRVAGVIKRQTPLP